MKTADDGMNLYCSICGKSIRFHSKIKCENQTWVNKFVPKEEEVEVLVEDTEPELEVEVEDADNAKEEEASEEVVEEEESDDDDEDLEAYLEALPVKELKKLCEEADLSKKGKKADLVARLLE